MKGGTQNFYSGELWEMENKVSERTKEMAKKVPYHLQYVREGKPMIKPNEGLGTTNEENRTY